MTLQIHTIEPPSNLSRQAQSAFAPHFQNRRFYNPWEAIPAHGLKELLRWKLSKNPYQQEKETQAPPTVQRGGLDALQANGNGLIFIGHASFLIHLDGLNLLIDPVFGSASPLVPRQTPPPFSAEALPPIDLVLITHGHYDHMDAAFLKWFSAAQSHAVFIVPLGLKKYLPSSCASVVELDWWQRVDTGGVSICFLPSQHWHQRGLADTNRALWGGFVIEGSKRLYHIGDSGYFPGFQAAKEVFGGFDTAILPVGAFEPRWFMKPQHMNPTESVQAFLDLEADRFVGMHWGTFDLTDEPIWEGPDRVRRLFQERSLASDQLSLPVPGEFIPL